MLFGKKENKEKRGLPDLPQSKTSFSGFSGRNADDFNDYDAHELPSFPDSPMKKGFSQAAIKDAITTGEVEHDGENLKAPKVREMEEWSPSPPQPQNLPEINSRPESKESRASFKPPPKDNFSMSLPRQHQANPYNNSNPVFVRLDKFQSAKKSLTDLEDRIEEISVLLKKISEVRRAEEEEIKAWEKETESLKARVDSIINDIFKKPDY